MYVCACVYVCARTHSSIRTGPEHAGLRHLGFPFCDATSRQLTGLAAVQGLGTTTHRRPSKWLVVVAVVFLSKL